MRLVPCGTLFVHAAASSALTGAPIGGPADDDRRPGSPHRSAGALRVMGVTRGQRGTLTIAALLLACVALPAAGRASEEARLLGARARASALAAQPVRFPVFLNDGAVLLSTKEPRLGFGSVRVFTLAGRSEWVPLRRVDLQRSREAWQAVRPWSALYTHAAVGTELPLMHALNERGTEVAITAGEAEYLVLELWRSYCMACRRRLPFQQAWYRRAGIAREVRWMAICVDIGSGAWPQMLEDSGLEEVPGWLTLRRDRPTEWMERALGPSSFISLLIDREGTVVHSHVDGSCDGSYSPCVLHALLEQRLGRRLPPPQGSD